MNNLHFACTRCKVYIDAGYRWAHWKLEQPGIVRKNANISIEAILSAGEYWSPEHDDDSKWLIEDVLPSVRDFLYAHLDHPVVFGEEESFLSWDDESFLEWLQIGFLPESLPRYFVEILNFKTWAEVIHYINENQHKP